MKRLLYFILSLTLPFCSFAQFGITSGINLSRYTYPVKKFDVHRKPILAYNIGIMYKKSLSEKIFVLPELGFTKKGTRVYYDYPIGYTGPMKHVNTLSYLELKLPVVARLPLTDEYDFEIGVGAYAGSLINAKQKTVEFDGSSITEKFREGSFKKIDAGIHFTTGFRMGKTFGLNVGYDLGLMNIEGKSENPSIKTRCFSLNLSWIFSHND